MADQTVANPHHEQAIDVLRAVAGRGLDAKLEITQVTPDKPETAEVDVVVDQGHYGLLHEDIAALVSVAETFNCRLFLREGELSFVWPLLDATPGPKGRDSPAVDARRQAHNGEAGGR